MNAIAVLQRQHAAIAALFDALELADDAEEQRQLFQDLADHLAAHATVEEEIFYPATFRPHTEGLILQALAGHLDIKRLLAEMLQLLPHAEASSAALVQLRSRFDHHIFLIEHPLFDEVAALMDEPHLEQLGRELHHRFEEQIRGRPHARLIVEVADAASA
jgi:hypothetical protein